MNTVNIRTLGQNETIEKSDDIILFKTPTETTVYDRSHAPDVSLCDILAIIFKENRIVKFSVTCGDGDQQNFLPQLRSIRDFNISGLLQHGETFEINFNHFYVQADELLDVDYSDKYIGNIEYDDRTTEWFSDSTVDTDSELYLLLKEQALSCNMSLSDLMMMLDVIAENCTGSDVEF